jgi:hypothetical protein
MDLVSTTFNFNNLLNEITELKIVHSYGLLKHKDTDS